MILFVDVDWMVDKFPCLPPEKRLYYDYGDPADGFMAGKYHQSLDRSFQRGAL